MASVDVAKIEFGFIDGSGERTRVQLHVPALIAGTLGDIATDANLVRVALEAITDLNETHVSAVVPIHSAAAILPSSAWAQREHGIRFTYIDTDTNKLYRCDVPGIDESAIRTPGTDNVDLTGVGMALFVTAFELTVRSPTGGPVNVQSGKFYGKNN